MRQYYPPAYPQEALDTGLEGTVTARVTIDRCGEVAHAEIVESSATVFEQPVLTALQLTAFHPARAGTLFIASRLLIPYEFRLD